MSTQAITGIGTKFQRSDDTTGFDDIAEVYSITGPGMTRETIDVTTFDSTGGYREKIGGLRDPGTVTFTMNFRKDTYNDMKDDFESDDSETYRIVLPDTENTTLEFDAVVTEIPLTIPEGDRITCDVTMEITGAVEVDPT